MNLKHFFNVVFQIDAFLMRFLKILSEKLGKVSATMFGQWGEVVKLHWLKSPEIVKNIKLGNKRNNLKNR